MTQHASLTPERWGRFTPDQRLLMIANEMHRVASSMAPADDASRRLGYERVLRLVDVTVQVSDRRALVRELLRWRDLAAELYLDEADPDRHEALFRALLLLSPAGAEQLRALRGELAPPG